MSYLQRLKALNAKDTVPIGTAKTVKSPSGSFGSSETGDFQEIDREPSPSTVIDIFEDRRHCGDCANLTPSGRCLAAWRGDIIASLHYYPIDHLPRRCEGYVPKAPDPDQRTGRQRWPGLRDT